MNMQNLSFSSEQNFCGQQLNKQIAIQMFEILNDEGLIMVIMDREGYFWASNPDRFSQIGIDESFLKELNDKIDDGDEPVVTQLNDNSVIATQLATDKTNCGYVIIILPHYTPESALINIDLIEMVLNQINLIAKLIEKNSLLYELQMKHHQMYSSEQAAMN
ncbi:MAG: hypothetical protein ACYSSI_07480 [Planctomycetota bacterium]|jgi:hypothetical protein